MKRRDSATPSSVRPHTPACMTSRVHAAFQVRNTRDRQSRNLSARKAATGCTVRGPSLTIALGRFRLIVDDRSGQLRQCRIGLFLFLQGGVQELYCPVYAQLIGPSLQCAVA